MTNCEKMRSYLRKNVIKSLAEQGFEGKYSHYRRIREDCIELIDFRTNKYGGSFTVEVSAIFPKGKDKNYTTHDLPEGVTEEELTVWDTSNSYCLRGMFDGWFYYRDVYSKYIIGFGRVYFDVSENKAKDFVIPKGYKLVQTFNDETAEQICCEVNRQLVKAFKWLNKFEKKHL